MILLALLLMQSNPFDRFDPKPPKFVGPARLVMILNGQPVLSDYPDAARCQMAANAASDEARRRLQEATNDLPPGATLTKLSLTVVAFCIPR